MRERITEAELADVERALVPSLSYAEGVTEAQANLARGVHRYITEVRRLRGIILAQDDVNYDTYLIADEFEAEVDAIRGEPFSDRGPVTLTVGWREEKP